MKSKTLFLLVMASSLALVAFSGGRLFAGGGPTEPVGQSAMEAVNLSSSDSLYEAQINFVGRPPYIYSRNECNTDEDCKDIRLRPCTAVKCVVDTPLKKIDWVSDSMSAGHKVCQVIPTKACDPCVSYKEDKAGYRCCGAGFDEAVDKEEFACCRKYFGRRREMASVSKEGKAILIQEMAGRESSSYYSVYAPHEVSKDFFKWMYQKCLTRDCPSAPVLDCNIFKDEATRACCAKFSDVPALAVLKCVKSVEECNSGLNIKAAEGSTVNVSGVNECCQAVFNSGDISSTTVSQACSNVASPVAGAPGGETAGGTTAAGTTGGSITTPSGSSSTPGAPADTGGGCSLVFRGR